MGSDETITVLITDAVELAPPILVQSPNPIVKEWQTMASGAMVHSPVQQFEPGQRTPPMLEQVRMTATSSLGTALGRGLVRACPGAKRAEMLCPNGHISGGLMMTCEF
jgi:hypothetical protein